MFATHVVLERTADIAEDVACVQLRTAGIRIVLAGRGRRGTEMAQRSSRGDATVPTP